MKASILKDDHFELVTQFAKLDGKKRLGIGGAEITNAAFNIYCNRMGQIILDPVKAVSVSESWLYENKSALASVKRGLDQSAQGETHDLGSFSAHAK